MFFDFCQQDTFLRNLLAYEQEFGTERVTVIFPKSWISKIDESQWSVQLKYWDINAVKIEVQGCEANFLMFVM